MVLPSAPIPLEPPVQRPRLLASHTFSRVPAQQLGPDAEVAAGCLLLYGRGEATMHGHGLTAVLRHVLVDVVMEAGGQADDEGFGVFVRQVTPTRYVALRVSRAGGLAITCFDGEAPEQPLAVGVLHDEIPFDPDGPNRFTVVAAGPSITLALNGWVVTGVLVDHRYAEGHAGVLIEQRHADSTPCLSVRWFQARALLPDPGGSAGRS